ncbi:MAG: hypothetical protein ACE5R6_05405 [Candidatus Heimdallarchaeota archaeon]
MHDRENRSEPRKTDKDWIEIGEGRTRIRITYEEAGKDLVVICTGGTVPHIGAVAIGVPVPRRKDPFKYRGSISVHTIPPHREDLIVRPAAEKLVRTLARTTVVVAGIHLDNPSHLELQQILENCDKGVNRIIENFGNAIKDLSSSN